MNLVLVKLNKIPGKILSLLRPSDYELWKAFTDEAKKAQQHLPTEDASMALIQAAIQKTIQRSLTTQESALIRKVERVRHETENSDEKFLFRDYGARSPHATLSAEEMAEGVLEERSLATMCRVSSKPPPWASMLFHLVRQAKPKRCIEMGTCVGISAAYIASALRINGEGGRLITLEGSDGLAQVARRNLDSLAMDNVEVRVGRFQEVLTPALQTQQPVNFIFVDGHHDERATMNYFEQVTPYLASNALVIFDDIRWSDGMARAWNAIRNDPRVLRSLSVGDFGVCIAAGAGSAA
jgi:predicted O-methyltransferase YrrM